MAKNHKYMQIRNGIYGIRVPVPKELQGIIDKKERTISFKTRVREQAEKLYPDALKEIGLEFERAKAKLSGHEQSLIGFNPLEEVRRWHHKKRLEIMSRTKAIFSNDEELKDYIFWAQAELVELTSSNLERRYNCVASYANDLLIEFGVPVSTETGLPLIDIANPIYHDLHEHLISSKIGLKELELSRLGEKVEYTPNGGLFEVTPASSQVSHKIGTPLSKLIKNFMSVYGQSGKAKTNNDKMAAFEYLVNLVGLDFFVEDLKHHHFLAIRNCLKAYPKNANKLKVLKGMTLTQKSEYAIKHKLPLMGKANANKIIRRLKRLMQYAVSSGLVSANPCLDLEFNISPAEKQKSERKPFSPDQLNTLFSSPAFKADYPKVPAMYWVPLIALFHGLRMEEILILTLDQIKTDEDTSVRYFDLTDFTTDDLKNLNARRRVPIHQELKRLGFLEYLSTCSNNKGKRLFPEVKRSKGEDKSYRKRFSQDFTRYRKEIGITQQGIVFHSFRKNFSIACTNGEIPVDFENALAGWSLVGGQAGTYKTPKDISLAKLKEMIDKIEYPGVNLTSLYKKPDKL